MNKVIRLVLFCIFIIFINACSDKAETVDVAQFKLSDKETQYVDNYVKSNRSSSLSEKELREIAIQNIQQAQEIKKAEMDNPIFTPEP